jgi:hypothetical protein
LYRAATLQAPEPLFAVRNGHERESESESESEREKERERGATTVSDLIGRHRDLRHPVRRLLREDTVPDAASLRGAKKKPCA